MPPEHGMPTRTAADAVVNRRPRRLFGRSSERKNPLNLQFVCPFSLRFPSSPRQSAQTLFCLMLCLLRFFFPGASSSSPRGKAAATEVHRCSILIPPVEYTSLCMIFLLSEFTSCFCLSSSLNLCLIAEKKCLQQRILPCTWKLYICHAALSKMSFKCFASANSSACCPLLINNLVFAYLPGVLS